MFERFTDRARRAVVLAQEEARLLNHSYIGTEHILLGLIHEYEGIPAKVLESLGVTLEAIRQQVEEIIGQGGSSPRGHIPFTPRAKKVLLLSQREALQLGVSYIGTEHILLGLLREGEGVAVQAIVRFGADPATLKQMVIHAIGSPKPVDVSSVSATAVEGVVRVPTRDYDFTGPNSFFDDLEAFASWYEDHKIALALGLRDDHPMAKLCQTIRFTVALNERASERRPATGQQEAQPNVLPSYSPTDDAPPEPTTGTEG